MIDVVLYKTDTCDWCELQSAVLKRIAMEHNGIEVSEILLKSAEQALAAEVETVPTTVIDTGTSSVVVEGFTEYTEMMSAIWPNRRT